MTNRSPSRSRYNNAPRCNKRTSLDFETLEKRVMLAGIQIEDFSDDQNSNQPGFSPTFNIAPGNVGIMDFQGAPGSPHVMGVLGGVGPAVEEVTFNLPAGEGVEEARVTALAGALGTTVQFIGTGDRITFQIGFVWETVQASSTDIGVTNSALGNIERVVLTTFEGFFDDITISTINAPPQPPADTDGVPNEIEDQVDGDGDGVADGDGNMDGVPDRSQCHVASLPNSIDGNYLTLQTSSGCFSNISAIDLDEPDGVTFPVGGFEFTVDGTGATTIDVASHVDALPDHAQFFARSATLLDPFEHLFEFTFDGTVGAKMPSQLPVRRSRFAIELVDGQRADMDLAANQSINHTGAPAIVNPGEGSGEAAIRGIKFHDINGNGSQDSGEHRLIGWSIYLDENNNGEFDSGEPTTETDELGRYVFEGLDRRSYRVGEVMEGDWEQTYPGFYDPRILFDHFISPRHILAEDFNHDGLVDFAVIDDTGDSVGILMQSPGLQFDLTDRLPVGILPESAVIGDWNGDGDSDIAVANPGSDDIFIYIGNGDGTFRRADPFLYPLDHNGSDIGFLGDVEPFAIDTADFDRNGSLDLVTVNNDTNDISLLMGNGDGTFQSPVHFGVGFAPRFMAIGQLTDDLLLDIVVSNTASDSLTFLRGVDTGTNFEIDRTIPAPGGVAAVRIGDFDDDRHNDVVVVNPDSNSLTVFFGNAFGVFGDNTTHLPSSIQIPVGDQPRSLDIVDFDRDGREDIIVTNRGDNTVAVFQGKDSSLTNGGDYYRYFARSVDVPTGSNPVFSATHDIDRSGIEDILVVNADDGTISVLIDNPGRTHIVRLGDSSVQSGIDFGNTSIFSGTIGGTVWNDLNGNGVRDNDSSGILEPASSGWSVYLDSNTNGVRDFLVDPVAITDVNGNYLFRNMPPQQYVVGIEVPNTDWNQILPLGGFHEVDLAANQIVTALDFGSQIQPIRGFKWNDLNANGVKETDEPWLAGKIIYIDTNHNAELDSNERWTRTDAQGAYFFDELKPNRNYPIAQLNDSGSTTTYPQHAWTYESYTTGASPTSVAAADVDLDGDADFVVANRDSHQVTILENLSDGTLVASGTFGAGVKPTIVIAEDLNGDSAPDLIIGNSGEASLTILMNSATNAGLFTRTQVPIPTGRIRDMAVADIDADGDRDVVLANAESNSLTLMRNDHGSLSVLSVVPTPHSPAQVVAGDFDLDGLTDFHVVYSIDATPFVDGSMQVIRNRTDSPGQYELLSEFTFGVAVGPSTSFVTDFDRDGDPDVLVAVRTNRLPPVGCSPFSLLHLALQIGIFGLERTEDCEDFEPRRDPGQIEGMVAFVKNNGDMQFHTTLLPTGSIVSGFDTGDYNTDSVTDLIAAGPSQVSVLLSQSDLRLYGVGGGPKFIRNADIDDDGDLDVIVSNLDSNNVTVLRNDGTGGFDFVATASHQVQPGSIGNQSFNFGSALISVRGELWHDLNRNLARDGDESFLQNHVVYVDHNNNGTFDSGEQFALSDRDGRYELAVGPGPHDIAVSLSSPWVSFPHTVTIDVGQQDEPIVAHFAIGNEKDFDTDGVADEIEDLAPDNGDGDGDGTPDREQFHVTSLPNAVDSEIVTLRCDIGFEQFCRLSNVQAVPSRPSESIPLGLEFPIGMFAFEIDGIEVGARAFVDLTDHSRTIDADSTYYKFGPTADQPTPHLYSFSRSGSIGAAVRGHTVHLYLVDGLRGDADLVANGRIIDPGGPAIIAQGDRGNVRVHKSGTRLIIKGDEYDNQIEIEHVGRTAYLIHGVNGTTVNGDVTSVLITGAKAVSIRTRGGDDSVWFDGRDKPVFGLTVLSGEGDDTVEATGSRHRRYTVLKTGSGADHVSLVDFSLEGMLRINTKAGRDSVVVVDSALGGHSEFRTQSGDDSLVIDSSVLDSVSVRLGDGADSLHIAEDFEHSSPTLFRGAVVFHTGDGDDTAYLGQRGLDQYKTFSTRLIPTIIMGFGRDLLFYELSNKYERSLRLINVERVVV